MEIVINISEEVKNRLCFGVTYEKDIKLVCEALYNGTVLPKGHGVLVDSKELRESIDKCRPFTKHYQDNYPMLNQAKSDLLMCLNSLTQIIAADKEDEDE